jgi:MFS superfamily sulfate permease-like transporter
MHAQATGMMPLRGYQRAGLCSDIVAGITSTAVAVPEAMGYTSIAQTCQ